MSYIKYEDVQYIRNDVLNICLKRQGLLAISFTIHKFTHAQWIVQDLINVMFFNKGIENFCQVFDMPS